MMPDRYEAKIGDDGNITLTKHQGVMLPQSFTLPVPVLIQIVARLLFEKFGGGAQQPQSRIVPPT